MPELLHKLPQSFVLARWLDFKSVYHQKLEPVFHQLTCYVDSQHQQRQARAKVLHEAFFGKALEFAADLVDACFVVYRKLQEANGIRQEGAVQQHLVERVEHFEALVCGHHEFVGQAGSGSIH
jgi:hypothetical protein